MRSATVLGWLVAIAAGSGCEDSTSAAEGDVAPLPDTGGLDALRPGDIGGRFDGRPESDGGAQGAFREPCEGNGDCASRWCVPFEDRNVCSRPCLDDSTCPEGWGCHGVANTRPDVVFICFPPSGRLCGLCVQDDDCPNGRCLELDGQRICGMDCVTDEACPPESICAEIEDGASQCVPLSGSCTCDGARAGDVRICEIANEHGACLGRERCDPERGWQGCDAPEPIAEVCNQRDDDCNGLTDDLAAIGTVCVREVELDGVSHACSGFLICGSEGAETPICAAPEPMVEICNLLDDDCDGETDEDFEQLGSPCSRGVGFCEQVGVWACDLESETPRCTVEARAPQEERCDGIDNDCDGEIDEGFDQLNSSCAVGEGACWRAGAYRCAPDGLSVVCSAGPGDPGEELCDGIDNDCDGAVDEGYEGLGALCSAGLGICRQRGFTRCAPDGRGVVCSAAGGEGEPEACNGIDDDCDGEADEDFPGLRAPCAVGVGLCRRAGVTVCSADGASVVCDAAPGEPAPEQCNGLDDDCDEAIDEDFPELLEICRAGVGACLRAGVRVCTADGAGLICDASAGAPGAERCNGIDDDCDGAVDEGFANLATPCSVGIGDCRRAGVNVCGPAGGSVICNVEPGEPAPDRCDGRDNDCDGATDEDFPQLNRPCQVGIGACLQVGVFECSADGAAARCNASPGAPMAEICDGIDNDCDGVVDDDLGLAPFCPEQRGTCAGARSFCAGQAGYLPCDAGSYGPDYEVNERSCDGIDNDCDGAIDEVDVDNDGHRPLACGGDDCDDLNPLVFEGAPETCGDGDDNDCNGTADDKDLDGDRHVDAACQAYPGPLPIDDCDDDEPAAHPQREEICGDGIDNDCDGSTDNRDIDGDNFIDLACGGTDCDDARETVRPGALEMCDGQDNDCNDTIDDKDLDADGHVDAACQAYPGPLPIDDCDDGNVGVNPDMDEVCGNRLDEDCSGAPDDKDIDRDGAVDRDPICGGDDCNDRDPMIYPGAREVRDGKDNDCDADGKADEGLLGPGAVVVTEVLYDSSQSPDENYEWFEVFNPGDRPVDLNTWLMRDAPGGQQEIALINEPVVVGPRDFAVLCRTGSPLLNGGVRCDYEYGFFQLGNTADELYLELDGLVIDHLIYDEAAGWPSATTGSMILDPDAFGADNNAGARWCNHPAGREIGNGDEGSPGVSNVGCGRPVERPEVIALHPSNGIDAGGAAVRVVGAGFAGVTGVHLGGAACAPFVIESDNEITCTLPAHPAGVVDVVVTEGGASDTLAGAFTFTRQAPAAARVAATLMGPAVADFLRGTWSEALYVSVQVAGLTGGGCPAGWAYDPAALIVEVGFGSPRSDPAADGSWLWFPAWCDTSAAGRDVFLATLTTRRPGTYAYAYRASTDGGLSWTYVDLDGAANGLDPNQLGIVVVE